MQTKAEIEALLKKGVCFVRFQKADGSHTEREASLHSNYVPPPDPEKPSRPTPDDVVSFWDVDKGNWSRFKIDNLLEEVRLVEEL